MARRYDALPAESQASGDDAAQTDHLDAGDHDVSGFPTMPHRREVDRILAGLALHGPGTWMAGLGAAWVVAAGTAGGLVVRGTA